MELESKRGTIANDFVFFFWIFSSFADGHFQLPMEMEKDPKKNNYHVACTVLWQSNGRGGGGYDGAVADDDGDNVKWLRQLFAYFT